MLPLFQVQETQESCGQLRRQEDAKWDLGRARYGENLLSNSRFCLSLIQNYSMFGFISNISGRVVIKEKIV